MDEDEPNNEESAVRIARYAYDAGYNRQLAPDIAARIRAYGEACRRAGAEAMRSTAAALASGWGAMKCSHAIAELPLPLAAEAAPLVPAPSEEARAG